MIIVVSSPKKEEIRAKIGKKTGRSLREINGSCEVIDNLRIESIFLK